MRDSDLSNMDSIIRAVADAGFNSGVMGDSDLFTELGAPAIRLARTWKGQINGLHRQQ